jgi:hypothetical protein
MHCAKKYVNSGLAGAGWHVGGAGGAGAGRDNKDVRGAARALVAADGPVGADETAPLLKNYTGRWPKGEVPFVVRASFKVNKSALKSQI